MQSLNYHPYTRRFNRQGRSLWIVRLNRRQDHPYHPSAHSAGDHDKVAAMPGFSQALVQPTELAETNWDTVGTVRIVPGLVGGE